jgi:hypothetical protein
MVKVVPKNDDIRKLLKHPVAGAMRAEGSSDWPDDSFTARRIADGDVTVEQAPQSEQALQAEEQHAEKEKKHDEDKRPSRSR